MATNIVTLNRNGIKIRLPTKLVEELPLSGSVYLIRCQNFYKIGMSKEIKKRVRVIQTSTPFEVEFVDDFFSCNAREDEKGLHRLCSEYHHRNEWFELPYSFVRNRKNWFKAFATPDDQIRQAMLDSCIETCRVLSPVDPSQMPVTECSFFEGSYSATPQFYRASYILNILMNTQALAHLATKKCSEIHNVRYQGLYEMNAEELSYDQDRRSSEDLLCHLSVRDLMMSALANTLTIESGNPDLMFDIARDIRESYKSRLGKDLMPVWERDVLRSKQS